MSLTQLYGSLPRSWMLMWLPNPPELRIRLLVTHDGLWK